MKRLSIIQTVATYNLWLAGLLILVHTAIPHHHHELDYDCHFHVTHCCDDSAHEYDENEKNNCCSNESCTLTHVVIRSIEDQRDEQLINTAHLLPIFHTLFNSEINFDINNKDLQLSRIFYIPLYHSNYISSSQSLRAPPFC